MQFSGEKIAFHKQKKKEKKPRPKPNIFRSFVRSFFIYLWLCWVSVAAHGLSLVTVSGGSSCCGARALGTRASVVVVHGLSCSAACGIFPDQGLIPCPLHRQADS